MKKSKGPKTFVKASGNSLIPEEGLMGIKLTKGETMLLNGSQEVTVISQRILKNFTTVSDGEKVFEVAADRLTKIK